MVGSTAKSLISAFRLAYFIHGDKAIAISIAVDAMDKLGPAWLAQRKRESDRSKSEGFNTRVSMTRQQLLQRLVYIESEPYEIEQERSGVGLDERVMLIRFIKHLVRITVRRNSFYVAIGLSRLLHDYNTPEAKTIYEWLIDDPVRYKDDFQYRRAKKILMMELKGRFGDFLKTSQRQRGEERFDSRSDAAGQAAAVECLNHFNLWEIGCEPFDSRRNASRGSWFKLIKLGEQDQDELVRMHAVLHYECYERLAAELKLAAPKDRLDLPHFSLTSGNDAQPPGNHHPPELEEAEIKAILSQLNERAKRRKQFSAGVLAITVDSIEQMRWQPEPMDSVQFEVGEDAELIEVWAREPHGDLLLAAHLLTCDVADAEQREYLLGVVGKQALYLTVSPSRPSPYAGDEPGRVMLAIRCQEIRSIRAFWALLRQQLAAQASELRSRVGWSQMALAASLLIAAVAIGGWFRNWQQNRGAQNSLANLQKVMVERDASLKTENQQLRQNEAQLRERQEQADREIAQLKEQVKDSSLPQLNIPVLDLRPSGLARRSSADPPAQTVVNELEIPSTAKVVTLILNSQSTTNHSSYSLELIKARDVVWSGEGLARNPSNDYTINLPTRYLTPGNYTLDVYGRAKGARVKVDSYRIRVKQARR